MVKFKAIHIDDITLYFRKYYVILSKILAKNKINKNNYRILKIADVKRKALISSETNPKRLSPLMPTVKSDKDHKHTYMNLVSIICFCNPFINNKLISILY